MSEVTTLLWDVGGVMLSNGWDRDARKAACERFGIEEEEFEKRHALVDEAFEMGRLTLDGYLDSTVFYQPRSFTREEFTAFIFAQSSANAGTIALLGELAGTRRYLMVTLNNEGPGLNEYRIHTFQLTRYFSAFLTSCYLGVRKPNESMYRLGLGILQRPADQCIFIDDRPPNLEPARRLGIHTIHFQSPAQLRADLADCGVRYE
jgi:putative hydrolase of the HAD superfamily